MTKGDISLKWNPFKRKGSSTCWLVVSTSLHSFTFIKLIIYSFVDAASVAYYESLSLSPSRNDEWRSRLRIDCSSHWACQHCGCSTHVLEAIDCDGLSYYRRVQPVHDCAAGLAWRRWSAMRGNSEQGDVGRKACMHQQEGKTRNLTDWLT